MVNIQELLSSCPDGLILISGGFMLFALAIGCVATVTVSCEITLRFKSGLNEPIFGSYEIFPKQKVVTVS
jgi:hypothetical protein